MYGDFSPQGRGERVIAIARLLLSAVALVAIYVDPSEPSRYSGIAYTILGGYVGFALAVLLTVHRSWELTWSSALVLHAIDLTCFTALQYFTEGVTSPFFAYFMFSLFAAGIRWRWRGVVWTMLVAQIAFLGMGVFARHVLREHDFELNRFIIRGAYLLIAGGLLAYLTVYEDRHRREMVELASWPDPASGDLETTLRAALPHAAGILSAPRLLLLWSEPEEPWLYVASWHRGEFEFRREAPDTAVVADSTLERVNFFSPDGAADDARVLTLAGERRLRPIAPAFQARYGIRSVLASHFHTERIEGRLLALDLTAPTADDLVLGGVVARQIGVALDRTYLLADLRASAASGERVRLARDLHDSVLQSLTGAALKLRTLQGSVADLGTARSQLEEVSRLIASEQHGLRSFIDELAVAPAAIEPRTFAERLAEVLTRIEQRWDAAVRVTMEPPDLVLPRPLANHAALVVHEAVVNAARHGRSSTIDVAIASRPGRVRIRVRDDGIGFPFRGRYDIARLAAERTGPVTLRERVTVLGGSMTVESTASGAVIEIELPHGGE